MPYPPRPQLKPLPEFAGQTHPGTRATKRLIEFVLAQYAAGLSLREIAELTDPTHSAVRNILDRAGVPRRPTGARRQHDRSGASSAIPIRLPVVDATPLILLVAGLCVVVAMPSSRIDLDRLERPRLELGVTYRAVDPGPPPAQRRPDPHWWRTPSQSRCERVERRTLRSSAVVRRVIVFLRASSSS